MNNNNQLKQSIMTDKEIFRNVFESFQGRYKGLEMIGTLVYYNGECVFDTDGYTLLYNLIRMCETLKKELL